MGKDGKWGEGSSMGSRASIFPLWLERPLDPPPVARKPTTRTPKPADTPGREVVRGSSSEPTPRPQPSREIGNLIRMYQSRPAPVPAPVQPLRWAQGRWVPGLLGATLLGSCPDQDPLLPIRQEAPE